MVSATPSSRPGGALAPGLRYAALAGVGAVVWLNLYKTLWVGIQGWGRPYWWLDYHHGFVRRGLAGELFQAVFGRLTEGQLVTPVDWIHRAFLLALIVALLFQLNAALRAQADGRRIAVVLAVTLWGAASQFWSTLAYNQGYLDVIVLALAALAAVLMRARLYWAVGACLVVGPFIHEYFCFLVPFVLASDRLAAPEAGAETGELVGLDVEHADGGGVPRHMYWLAGAALVAAELVMLLPAGAAARHEIAAMPMSAEDRTFLIETTMQQSLQQSLQACLELFFRDFGFTLKNMLFFAGPAFLATGVLLVWAGRRPSLALWLRATAALFPIAALALAWDLSRLLVMVDFTAVMLFLMTAQDLAAAPRADRSGRPWGAMLGAGAAGLLALAYLVLPGAYVYYPPGTAVLFPLTSRLGLHPQTLGVRAFWPNATIANPSEHLPSDQKRPGPQLLHDLQPVEGASRPGLLGWRIAAAPQERQVLYGPYIDLRAGRYRASYRLHPQRGAACAAPSGRIEGTAISGAKPLTAPTHVDAGPACAWTISADLDIPAGGAVGVETHLFLKAPEALLADGYALVPEAAAQSR